MFSKGLELERHLQPCEVILTACCLGPQPLVTIPAQCYLLGAMSPQPLLFY